MKNAKLILFFIFVAIVPVLIVWAPFFLRSGAVWGVPLPKEGMQTVAANYDGPLYIVIAKSFYNLNFIASNYSFPLPLEYYAAHFPLFPILIRIFAVASGYPWGMLIATLASSVFCMYYFYLLAREHLDDRKALWLTAVFAVFPARWLIVRSVGSPEPFFVGAIIASIYHFNKKQYWAAGVWGALAQLTKSPGILLFIAYIAALIIPRLKDLATNHSFYKWMKSLEYRAYPILLIPGSLLGLFFLYRAKFDDFFAYFHSGDNIHLMFPPFQIFNYSQSWVNTHWLEGIIFIYLFGVLGLIALFKQKKTVFAWFVGVFFTTLLFVSHRDLMRYALPIVPFILIAFSKQINSKEFKIAMALLIIPIYLFTLAFIANNAMPISDWTPLL